jgi:hypothetical protein
MKMTYETYLRIQNLVNRSKINSVWALEKNIEFLAKYIERTLNRKPGLGICHGTRNGKEIEWFHKYLGCTVFGTEIANTAELFPMTIQWDFHDPLPGYFPKADFIYTNSFDHAIFPAKALNAWMDSLKRDGVCIIEHTSKHENSTETDPNGLSFDELLQLIPVWIEEPIEKTTILTAPVKKECVNYCKFVVFKRYIKELTSGDL